MKTLRKEPVEIVVCDDIIPATEMEQNKMYYIPSRGVMFHLCLCGCKTLSKMNIEKSGWTIHNMGKLTITPSIEIVGGYGCNSHYIVTKGVANFV